MSVTELASRQHGCTDVSPTGTETFTIRREGYPVMPPLLPYSLLPAVRQCPA